ncbi:MAG: carboxypeptidase-like regulatory domain-containing protein [Chloroflexi bacterium]|nr:carboxypeptidase-like regulatory domain-containing protein [Chloroflexota bacterium]MCL5274478.1 carboxypeptidase-like regulatory domain-containing protein [Chloroflexota bacterium]
MRQRLIRALGALACFVAVGLPQAGRAQAGVTANFTDLPITLAKGIAPDRVAAHRPTQGAPAASCTKLTVHAPAAWFEVDSDGNVNTDSAVDSYPSGATILAPGFTYDCVPKDTDVVVIIYNQAYGDQPALVEKRTLPASAGEGVFFYGLTTPDGSALQDGKWRVAFYQGKTSLATGEILVGGAASVDTSRQAVLGGAVSDLRSGQPVADARIFVLNPGVTIADFTRDPRREDIFAQTRSDAQGQFSLWKPLERNTAYAVLIAADGYKLRGANNLTIGDDAESPVNLEIQLVQK